MTGSENHSQEPDLRFLGGPAAALVPFVVFVAGVIAVSLSGSPDEKGFWPILLFSLFLGLLLARNRKVYSEAVIRGMSQPIVLIMITAWMLASCIGVLMRDTGLIEALTRTAGNLHLEGAAFTAVVFIICCLISVSTGTSFGTILICGPILYPAGGMAGAHPAVLAGAILAGATFGDSIAPISDTTIAAALSQKADIGGTVRSRLKYVLPAGAAALVLFLLFGGSGSAPQTATDMLSSGTIRGLSMLFVPVVIIVLLLCGRHLLEGLLFGLFGGIFLGLALNILPMERVFSLNAAQFSAQSFLIDGVERAVGISFFTILLMGLIGTLEASGLLRRLVAYVERRKMGIRTAETWIAGAVCSTVLLTCHSIVAILTVGDFAKRIGESKGIHPYRRANLLSLTVSIFPFLLPYFIPVILTANTTQSGLSYGLPRISPLETGLFNFYSLALIPIIAAALFFGYGRRDRSK